MKRNILIYGAGATGKSTRVAEAATWLWKTHKKKTRIVNADGGGTRSAVQHLIDAEVAELWDVDLWDGPGIFSTLDLATKGYWPTDVDVPNSELIPAVKEWKPCPRCGGDSGATAFAMPSECKSCATPFGAGVLPPVQRELVNGAEDVGLWCFEGLTAFGELMLRRLRQIDSKGGMSIKDGEFMVAQPGQQHYGMAQSYIGQFVGNTRSLPTDYTIWTALELRSDDDGKPLYGPALPGKKLTAMCIPWFTDVLHLDALAQRKGSQVVKDKDGLEVLERKLFLMPHFPPDNPMYKFAAKTSAPEAGGMPSVIDARMGIFFEELAKAEEKARASLQ